ncbi:hypothetical protein [Streptomyces bohaiensis]|uniref:hypothetical protein n=1 Tax=Streptomyces bohaiensis TaxID=1431344 RepID=UPI001ADDCB07|nr:hypothetical protein [Streptomyces bohaiensis]
MVTRSRGNPVAFIVALLANLAAVIIVLWILLFMLGANRDNTVVDFVHDAASWLASWSRDMFNVSPDWWHVLLNYGIAAVVYAAIGNLAAGALRRRW